MRLARETDSEIHTTLRGRRYATSIGGTLTGRGGNLFIIDDPLKPGDAVSEASRESVIDWYRSTLVTRPDDKQVARIMVVMQRIHVEDLVGYLLENESGFEVLSLPSVAQSTITYDLGGGRTHTRERGDLLHPAHEPAEVLRDLKRSMGSMLFSAQYQQSPEPAGGKIIKRKMLHYSSYASPAIASSSAGTSRSAKGKPPTIPPVSFSSTVVISITCSRLFAVNSRSTD
jgi:hypothetical protein